MNKIYKVIWSKVKHQYVVVSELAHSNGKQSRTSRNSIRSRIAALVVCGAIAAFGVFNTLPTSSAFAEDVAKANEYQYVAIKATDDSDTKVYKDPSSEKTYNYHSEFINGERYWVRDGYTIEQIEGQRFPNAANDVQIQAIKSPNASTEGLLQSNRVLLSTPGHSTVLGNTLQKADVGVYMGATNEGGTLTPSSWNYYIQKNDGSYIDAGGANFDKYFVEAIKQADGTYQVNGKTVSSENLYVINDRIYLGTNEKGEALYKYKEDANNLKLGAFVVDGQVYTKNVFGKYNEVLMSAQQGNTYYSYWAANTYDADAPMQLTQGQYKDIVDTMWGNDTYLASSDVSQVKVEQTTEPGKNGGTISLIQQGDYHEGVNGEDGYYENNKTVPGAITITSEGGIDGKDVAVKFANTVNGEESSFTVNAGSKVQGINNDEVVQGSNETTTTIDGLEINGQKYSFDSKTYTDGDGIKFEGTDDGTISVDLATNDEKENISGLHFKNGQLANNLSIEEATPVEGETHSNKGNWSIIEDTGDGTTKTFTNTTLDSTASETANEEAEENSTYVDKDTETSKVTTTYGRDYVVKDTDGNEVELKDIASASTLKDIDINKIGDLQYSEVINEEDPNYDPNTDLTIEDDDSLTVAVGKLDNRVTNNTTNINNLTETVNEGWTAQAGENSIKVTPKDGKNTLNFAGDNNITVSANEATSTIQVGLEDDITLDDNVENGNNVQLSGTNGTISAHNSKFIFDGTGNYDNANDMTFDQNGLTVTNTQTMRENGETTTSSTVINGGSITTGNVTAGGITVNADNGGTVNGLTNKTWNPDNYVSGQAATEDQLKKAVDNIEENDYDGWKVSANGVENGVDVTTGSTVDFSNTDGNIVVGQDGTNLTFDLAKDITLDDGVENGNNVKLSGTNGTINAHNSELIFGGTGKYDNANDMTFDQNGLTVTNTQTMRENGETATSSTVINGGSITTGNVTAGGITVNAGNGGIINGLTNKTWNADNYVSGQAATEDQLKEVVDDIEANDYDGWKVSANGQTGVDVTTGSTVDFSNTDGNIVVGQNGTNLTFDLAKDITLDDGVENGNNVKLSGTNGTINAHNSELIFGGTGKYDNVNDMTFNQNGLTITNTQTMRDTGETTTSSTVINGGSIATGNITAGGITVNADNGGTVNGLTNKTWDADNYVSGQAATEDQLKSVSDKVNAGWIATDSQNNEVNITPDNNKLNFAGDENVTVTAANNEIKVALNDDITLKGDSSSIELTGTKGTIQVNQETAEGTNFTNINGNVVSIGYTNSEGIENAIVIDGGKGTITGLSNTTWDDELAKQVANSEELQGTAATQGQLQQAVSEVAEVANAGWNAKAGGNTINVKPNETLNFEGDGNITVSATGGTSNELKFGLNDNITLGDKAGQKTSTSLTLYTDPTLKEVTRIGEDGNPETVKVTGYIPESYIDDQERVDNFISTHGGFMMYATNTSGEGVFGITTDGMVHAKDVISYMPNSDSTSKDKILKYSLNDIGDIVTQIAHGQYDKTGMEYTLISDFSSQADKDKPFQPEEGERTIGLAVREDGAVVVGAVVNEDGYINDSGIRINAEKRVNKDGTTSSDNMATITGLENTTWTPPEPEQSQIATFADDTPKTSRAATESQLNDLYSSVVGYNTYMTKDGSVNIDYGHVTLKGEKKYTVTTDANGVKSYSGGVILDNVAYASGEEGNEAVNVDYLNDAIKDAVKDGPVASNEKHLDTSKTYTPDKTTGKITINEVDGTGAVTGNQLVINDVASKAELDSLKTGVGDRNYNNVTDTTPIANGDSVTTAIGKLNNSIKGVTQDVINNSISGGHVDETGKVVLEKGEGENKSEVTTDIQLTDSEVSGVTLEKDTETGKNVLTITSTDKYDKNKTSSVTVSGLEIASTDDIKDVTGVASSEDLKDAYKDADKDGNATTEYITDSESMVEADVALDHAIQDVANTSYANDMVLSNRIDSVEKRLGNVEERIDKVGAMAAAIANLRTMGFDPEAPTEIAIGVGQYKSETGIAIGVFHYPNQDFMLSASLSSSGDELMGGIGATWKLGRKSAAERAKDEEARHLEQAEEMKKLAQQEKVKAQAQRHAKLLAERQQASQKNA